MTTFELDVMSIKKVQVALQNIGINSSFSIVREGTPNQHPVLTIRDDAYPDMLAAIQALRDATNLDYVITVRDLLELDSTTLVYEVINVHSFGLPVV